MLKLGAWHLVMLSTAILLGDALPDVSTPNILNLVANGSTAGLLATFLFYFYPKSQSEVAKMVGEAYGKSEAAIQRVAEKFTAELAAQRESADRRYDALLQMYNQQRPKA